MQWLYTSKLVVSDEEPHARDDKFALSNFEGKEYDAITTMFIFADSMMDISLQNSAMDLMRLTIVGASILPGTSVVKQAVYKTMEGSPLRRFLVDMHCSISSAQWLVKNSQGFSAEFLAEMVGKFATARELNEKVVNPKHAPKCCYHVHNDDVPTCK